MSIFVGVFLTLRQTLLIILFIIVRVFTLMTKIASVKIIGTVFLQCDLKDRQVDPDEIEAAYKKHGFIGWTETSAKVVL